jgi:DNA-binding transcriptional LysR family regulator
MDHSLPPLEAFEAVLQAACIGTFSGAAIALDITHGAVSRRIGQVEAWAGVRLFERHGRGVRLTVAGEDLAVQLDHILRQLRNVPLSGTGDTALPVVRVGVVNSFARLWIIPRLACLEGEPKDLHIHLDIDHRLMPMAADRLAVRYGIGPWPGSRSTPLGREVFRPYATAVLAEKLPPDPAPEDLLAHPLIHDQHDDGWPIWLDSPRLPIRYQDRYLPGYDLTMLAAAEGLGITLVREPYGAEYCKSVGLISLSNRTAENPKRYHVLTHNGRPSAAAQTLALRMSGCSLPGRKLAC